MDYSQDDETETVYRLNDVGYFDRDLIVHGLTISNVIGGQDTLVVQPIEVEKVYALNFLLCTNKRRQSALRKITAIVYKRGILAAYLGSAQPDKSLEDSFPWK